MERILSNQVKENIGKEVLIKGWVHALRDLGSVCFLIVRDRGGLIQVVLDNKEEVAKLDNLYTGTVVSVTGKAAENKKSKAGYEIQSAKLEILKPVKHPSPVDISKSELKVEQDTLLDEAVVTLRHPSRSAVFKIYSVVERNMRKYFDDHDFTQINSPKIIAFPTEGGSEVFEVKYFDRKVYLAQSPQFYKQMMAGVYERVYEIAHSFRAEKSNTSRHMSEMIMLDMEMAFIESFEDIILFTQEFVRNVIEETWKEAKTLLESLKSEKPLMPEKFPRISVKDLHALMKKETGKDFTKERDVSPVEERFVCEYSKKNWKSDFVFVTEFPWDDAKFYHHQNEINPEVTDRGDLIFRGVEITTLTRREVNYEKLIEQIKSKGLDPQHPGLVKYLDAFKYGMPDEGGFGFGPARFVQKIIGLENVKEAELFPRDVQRVTP